MDQDTTVNKLLLSVTDHGVSLEAALKQAYAAGYDERTKELSAHHKKKIIQYTIDGEKIGEFESILEAATANKLKRGVIDDSLSKRTQVTRKHGYYFEYAEI